MLGVGFSSCSVDELRLLFRFMARLKMLKLQRVITAGYKSHLGATIQLLFHNFEGIVNSPVIIDLVHGLLEPHHRVFRHKSINALCKIQHARLRLFCVV